MDASTSCASTSVSKSMNRIEIPWPGGPSKKQLWSLPESIIYYMAKNPSSPGCYQKMIESCKFFFEKNPILVVTSLKNCGDGISNIFCSNISYEECKKNDRKCCIDVDIKKLQSKIWLSRQLIVGGNAENFTLLLPMLYRCDINALAICDTSLLLDDFRFLALFVKNVILLKNTIKYDDGKDVMLDKIIECLPNVQTFQFEFEDDNISLINDSTMTNIMKLQSLNNLLIFELRNIPESLNVETIHAFITKYQGKVIRLYFNDNISDEYKSQLDALIRRIIESNVPRCLIIYDGQNGEKLEILNSRCKPGNDDDEADGNNEDEEDSEIDFDNSDVEVEDDE